MGALFAYVAVRPGLSAALVLLCLTDAANCIRLGHADWFVPCIAAIGLIAQMRPPSQP